MAIFCGVCGKSIGESLKTKCPHCGNRDITKFSRGESVIDLIKQDRDRKYLENRRGGVNVR